MSTRVVRTQIYLPADHHRALRREAQEVGLSLTALIRRLVADHVGGLRGVESVSKDAVRSFVGLGESGAQGVSEHHDAVLDEVFRDGAVRGHGRFLRRR
ncbi:MAG: hypothetical protein HYY06_23965 [Deltaproteobacteria bacterium]|nr:hypothetical protein [Deltaproteobacteria bacterium]